MLQNLSDRQAADAVRARIDWKYALGLELSDEGFHYSALSEFRTRLVAGSREQILLDRLLERCRERGWLKARGRQRTDSTHIVGAVRALNQLELVGETLRHTLNVLATVAPEWLKEQVPPDWYERYGERMEDYRLPKEKREREALSQHIGDDGYYLLACVEQAAQAGMDWLKPLPSGPDARADLGAAVSPHQRSCANGHAPTVMRQRSCANGHAPTVMRVVSRRRNAHRSASGCARPMTATCATAANATWSGWATKFM